MSKTHLLIMDPQYDFCDYEGSLYVDGAENDMKRLAELINSSDKIDSITVSLDTHTYHQIFYPTFWIEDNGNHPQPFTTITIDDIKSGKYRAKNDEDQLDAVRYIASLESTGRYKLTIWPYHCIVGSLGYTIDVNVYDALAKFQLDRSRDVYYYSKGSNIFTEHYSIVRAEVEDKNDLSTQVNYDLLDRLASYGSILIAGEALSHCVINTLIDIASSNIVSMNNVILLTDTTSIINGFEDITAKLLGKLKDQGMKSITTAEFLDAR